jgi:[glutamine synthetase] adenylyltransferase / [glutamine synthetase]-adenylyl-L-tyrosine phosphorylase
MLGKTHRLLYVPNMDPKAVAKMNDALMRAERHAPYLRMLMARFPDLVDDLAAGTLNAALPVIADDMPIARALRIAKARLALSLAIGDLAGMLSFEEVVGSLSYFADVALGHAITAATEAIVPGADPAGFAAIALGKHGSGELNYSSDIDPILLFDPETLPARARHEPVETAVRIGRKIVEIMQARDGDGYVFRIDLRLRPTPEVTPIVLPVNALISYYESQAVPWERAAFIRARACAGDVELGQSFLNAIRPFVWRRGLDFGAIGEIRGISRRIRDHHASGQRFGAGFDLKRGRGGIREVEFYAQIHQLIFGGRDDSLRSPATLDALSALAKADRIEEETHGALSDAYRLYRTIEHRLQMVDDLQTHALPKQQDAMDNVAQMHGLANGAALIELLRPHVERVGIVYDSLDGEGSSAVPRDSTRLEDMLKEAGFDAPDHAAQRIGHWRQGTIRALRTPAARDALEAVLPRVIAGLGAAPDPQHAINQLSNLIERLPSAINLFRLLEAQPALLTLLVSILSHAPTLAEQLAQRAELLDSLIDATAFDPVADVPQLCAEMKLDGALEAQLDHVRRVVGDHRFALGVQVIEGRDDPLLVAKGYARVAEAAISVVADATIREFERSHGRVPGSELLILALGRMGGAELTHASDLDLVFLYTGSYAAESDGVRSLGATHYYNRLTQRVIAGLSVATAAGPLYEVDTRLRPSGAQGPLVISCDAFAKYQKEEAWTWEHMALTRARPVYGSGPGRAVMQTVIDDVLQMKRASATLLHDAKKMRSDIALHKTPSGPLDIKLLPGGLVDLEFAVHVLQLLNRVALLPDLGAAVAALSEHGFVAPRLCAAHALLTRLLVTIRLVAPAGQEPAPSTRAIVARACGFAHWDDLLKAVDNARQDISSCWAKLIAKKEDDDHVEPR